MRIEYSCKYIKLIVTLVMVLIGATARGQLVISTTSHLRYAAEELAAHRLQHDSIRSLIVYDVVEPDSLRRLCQSLYHTELGRETFGNDEGVRYLTIFGKTPVWHLPYQSEEEAAPCDDFYTWLDQKADTASINAMGRNKVCIGVGRIPAESYTDAHAVVQKIVTYDSNYRAGKWKGRICLLADNDQAGDANTHMKHCEALADILERNHPEFFVQKIYLPAYSYTPGSTGGSYPDAEKEFGECLTQGCLVVNYAGHGSVNNITGENMMSNHKAERLNMPYLPLWITATCKVGWWDRDRKMSMCETLLANPNGGAIGAICTTRDVYASSNLELNKPIIENLFNRQSDGTRYRLGEVLAAAKNQTSGTNKLRYCLLGDASMTLAFPRYDAQVETVNGTTVTPDQPVTLKALQPVSITGSVSNPDFNGLVYVTAYDAPSTLETHQIDGNARDTEYTFQAIRNKVFVGKSTIENGRFKVDFTVPKSIRTSEDQTMLTLYASEIGLTGSEAYNEAIGSMRNILYQAGASEEQPDTVGPQVMKIYFGDESFRDGDAMGRTPYFFAELWDESGFDVTGSVLGRDMTLTITCLSDSTIANRQYTLNDYFTTMVNQPTRGALGYLLPELQDGTYSATLRVCDIYNNVSVARIRFRVDTSVKPKALRITAYPSPVNSGEPVHFRIWHDRPQSESTMRLQLFTQDGRRIYETTVSTSSAAFYQDPENESIRGYSEITYSGYLVPGFYVYRVYMQSGGSEEVSDAKIFMVNP